MDILIASGHIWLSQSDLPSNGRFLGKPCWAEAMIAALHALVGRAAPLLEAQGKN
jgi:hypothetical protein